MLRVASTCRMREATMWSLTTTEGGIGVVAGSGVSSERTCIFISLSSNISHARSSCPSTRERGAAVAMPTAIGSASTPSAALMALGVIASDRVGEDMDRPSLLCNISVTIFAHRSFCSSKMASQSQSQPREGGETGSYLGSSMPGERHVERSVASGRSLRLLPRVAPS